ncbi:hypothetical protein HN695_00220 [Candidatus Woesearchaeota archaeon]|jgi:hypothetical protein|nr:hypothetical protein [Candidatus Woesearchaeota archaeon]MBT5272555.1 hypothetical protein [Candidatus Woesearchaeota archaeon]MBT6041296.1 hypothetical protein [Candidatus Woesearchaeota archaeon]MBT6337107.1 hypothetical protein [Candidatus Woesearchaeota archaeon]MBT7926738.1 hypothetical protein [Candidatus Woesearchaeota archaeon]
MIKQFIAYESLFKEIDQLSELDIHIYVIGGAVLLYRDIKPATKDIDIVVNTKQEFDELIRVLHHLGFEDTSLKIGYDNFNLDKQLKKGDIHIDVFQKEICSKFSFSETMIKRSEEIISLNKVKIYLSSNEDVFSLKTMTERPGDLDDCVSLSQRGLDWDVILIEIKSQIENSGKNIWITWINERLLDLEEKGVSVPILDKTNGLACNYMGNLDTKSNL